MLHGSPPTRVAFLQHEYLLSRAEEQDTDGTSVLERPRCLVVLYQRGSQGATYDELCEWAKPSMRRNLRLRLDELVHDKARVHHDGVRYTITRSGQQEVEARGWLDPIVKP
jgi:hypothetical protein